MEKFPNMHWITSKISTPRWLLTACILSALFALPFNLLPIVLGSAADYFSLNTQQTGLLGSSLTGGWVLGTGLAFWLMRFIGWRSLAVSGIAVAVMGYLLSLLTGDVKLLYLGWAMAGLGSPAPFCIALKMLTAKGDQERNMGIKMASEVFFGAALLYLFPVLLIQQWQYPGAATGMATCMALGMLVVRHIPARGKRAIAPPARNRAAGNYGAWVALVAFMIFFGGQTALWAFLERVGQDIGASASELGIIFAVVKVLGGAAGITAALFGSRFGVRWPHLLGFGSILAGIGLLNANPGVAGYAVGSWLWEFGFALSQCYQMAAITRLDISRRLIVLAPGAAGVGAMFGPAIAGFLKTGDSYAPIFQFTLSCSLIGSIMFLFLLSAHRPRGFSPAETPSEPIAS